MNNSDNDNSKFTISIKEGYFPYDSVSNPKLVIFLETEKIYECANYKILTDTTIIDNNLIIEILDIPHPDVCLTSFDNARSEDIFLAWSEGEYNIIIKNASETNSLKAIISKDRIKITALLFNKPSLFSIIINPKPFERGLGKKIKIYLYF